MSICVDVMPGAELELGGVVAFGTDFGALAVDAPAEQPAEKHPVATMAAATPTTRRPIRIVRMQSPRIDGSRNSGSHSSLLVWTRSTD